MDEPTLRKKMKIDLSNIEKYIYVFVVAFVFALGVSYGLTFFVQNKKVSDEVLSVGGLSINLSDESINLTSLVPSTDNDGLSLDDKELIITNTSSSNGKVNIKLERTSGLELTDLRYALFVQDEVTNSDVLVNLGDVPSNGDLYESAILPNEVITLKVKLWPKSSYAGVETTFVGELGAYLSLSSVIAVSYLDEVGLVNNNVWFNCDFGYQEGVDYCSKYKIVGIEDDRLVITSDLENASNRTNSNIFISTLTSGKDESLIYSVSNDAEHKNLYLLRTTIITSGDGSVDNPYVLNSIDENLQDRRVIGNITYNKAGTIVSTQPIYLDYPNYISYTENNIENWSENSDGTGTAYNFGEIVNFNTNKTIYAVVS